MQKCNWSVQLEMFSTTEYNRKGVATTLNCKTIFAQFCTTASFQNRFWTVAVQLKNQNLHKYAAVANSTHQMDVEWLNILLSFSWNTFIHMFTFFSPNWLTVRENCDEFQPSIWEIQARTQHQTWNLSNVLHQHTFQNIEIYPRKSA